MMKAVTATVPTTTNPKSLVMFDGAGKMAALKLNTATGLHVYDGTMLWVNPAQTVTAAAPRVQAAPQPTGQHKPTKALPIVDPTTGDELVVKKPEIPPSPPVAAQPPPARPPPPAFIGSPSPPSAVPGLVGSLLSSAAPVVSPAAPTVTPSLFVPPPAAPTFPQAAPAPAQKEQNIVDLLAKATKQSPSALLAMSKPLLRAAPVPGRALDDDEDRGKGRQAGKGVRNLQPDAKGGKGRGSRPVVNNDSMGRRKETSRYPGERYTKDAKYTASLDGRFWSLSCWPTGERDSEHRLTFGKHKLDVVENGVVKVVLFGGVNRYKVRLHLCTEGDDMGTNDKDGWSLATCEPSAANLQLTEEAEQLGWKVYKGGEHPLIYPPGAAIPELDKDNETKQESEATQQATESSEEAPAATQSNEAAAGESEKKTETTGQDAGSAKATSES